VKEIRVATPRGEEISLSKEENGSASFDSFFGSEGTPGVITGATLHIHPKPETVLPQLASFDDMESLVDVVGKIVERRMKPFFIEIQDGDYLGIKRSIGLFAPDAAFLALFVFEGQADQTRKDAEYLRDLVSEAGAPCCPRKGLHRNGMRGSTSCGSGEQGRRCSQGR